MIPILIAAALLTATGEVKKTGTLAPSPDLSPARVIEIQLDALRLADVPKPDAGIVTAFRFASPANREVTGPVDHFIGLVKTPAYRPLLNHRIAGFGPLTVVGGVARRRVTVIAADGRAFDFEFQLSKDLATGCWATDAVVPIPTGPAEPKGNIALSS